MEAPQMSTAQLNILLSTYYVSNADLEQKPSTRQTWSLFLQNLWSGRRWAVNRIITTFAAGAPSRGNPNGRSKVNQKTVEGKSVLAKGNSICKTWREKLAKKPWSWAGLEQEQGEVGRSQMGVSLYIVFRNFNFILRAMVS